MITVAKKRWHFIVGGVCISAGVYASFLSMTRGSWLLIPLLVPVFIYLYRRQVSVKSGLVAAVGLLMLVGTASFWLPSSVLNGVKDGINELHLYQKDPGKFLKIKFFMQLENQAADANQAEQVAP